MRDIEDHIMHKNIATTRLRNATLFEEHREAEIGGFQRGILILTQQQEVLGLEVPMDHPH